MMIKALTLIKLYITTIMCMLRAMYIFSDAQFLLFDSNLCVLYYYYLYFQLIQRGNPTFPPQTYIHYSSLKQKGLFGFQLIALTLWQNQHNLVSARYKGRDALHTSQITTWPVLSQTSNVTNKQRHYFIVEDNKEIYIWFKLRRSHTLEATQLPAFKRQLYKS